MSLLCFWKSFWKNFLKSQNDFNLLLFDYIFMYTLISFCFEDTQRLERACGPKTKVRQKHYSLFDCVFAFSSVSFISNIRKKMGPSKQKKCRNSNLPFGVSNDYKFQMAMFQTDKRIAYSLKRIVDCLYRIIQRSSL